METQLTWLRGSTDVRPVVLWEEVLVPRHGDCSLCRPLYIGVFFSFLTSPGPTQFLTDSTLAPSNQPAVKYRFPLVHTLLLVVLSVTLSSLCFLIAFVRVLFIVV